MTESPIALLVEDEPQIRRVVRLALEAEQWQVFDAETLLLGVSVTKSLNPDVIVLDLGMPDGDGIDFIREVRAWSTIPIIVLSARIGEADKISALDAGADDYLTKPFGAGELLARVRATLRRQRQPAFDEAGIIRFGDVVVDLTARAITKSGETVHLTPTEYQLLTVLLHNAGRVVTNSQLLRAVWGRANDGNGHYLAVYMGRLRKKLESDPAQPAYLQTETAVGYRLLLNGEPA